MTEQTERLSLTDLRTEAKNRRCELVTNEFLEDLLRRSNRLADLERENINLKAELRRRPWWRRIF